MSDQIFMSLYDAMTGPAWLVVLASFGWGLLSVLLSPCHLSSIPLVVGYISMQGKTTVSRTLMISLVFASGMLVTIALIGAVTASMGRMMGDIGTIGNYLVAGIFFLVGLYLLEVVKFDWDLTGFRKTGKRGIAGAFILGLLFGLALGPCTFAYMAPVLGIVFDTAQSDYAYALMLLLAFGLGHCAVIVTAGTMTTTVQRYLDWSDSSPALLRLKKVCGVLVLCGGVYLLFITI